MKRYVRMCFFLKAEVNCSSGLLGTYLAGVLFRNSAGRDMTHGRCQDPSNKKELYLVLSSLFIPPLFLAKRSSCPFPALATWMMLILLQEEEITQFSFDFGQQIVNLFILFRFPSASRKFEVAGLMPSL